jgi:hypothetical protein
MSGDHAKKEMETGEKPTTSHGSTSSEESRTKRKEKKKSSCDTPGVNFALCREINPNLGCSVKISLSRSRMSLIIQIIHLTFYRIRSYSVS